MFTTTKTIKTFEQKVADEAIKQWMELYSVKESFRIAKSNARNEENARALAIVNAKHQVEQAVIAAKRDAEKQAIVAAGGRVFKADAPKLYRPTKNQVAFAGKLAREIRDSGATKDSAHSLAKYFTIDTLIEMRDAIKASKAIVVEF
jgi:hypothetical protein